VAIAYVGLGILAFGIAGLFDWAELKGWRQLKWALGLSTISLLGYALYHLLRISPRFWLPAPLVRLGWLILLLGTLLLIYSAYVEVSLGQARDHGEGNARLVTTGTYALCRHPGVLWFGLSLVALLLVSRASYLLFAAPIWFLADVLLAWAQDVHHFPRMFPEYPRYRQCTPMLIPTAKSMALCLRSLGRVMGPLGAMSQDRHSFQKPSQTLDEVETRGTR